MGDQPVTKADFEGFAEGLREATTNLIAVTAQLANLVTGLNNQVVAYPNQVNNAGQRGGETRPIRVNKVETIVMLLLIILVQMKNQKKKYLEETNKKIMIIG